MVPPLEAALVLGKEGILRFRNLVNIHHLDRPLLFGIRGFLVVLLKPPSC